MTDAVLAYIKELDMLPDGGKVLCGVSGGADSMALLLALRELSDKLDIEPVAAHYNHMLRGEESERDELFVRGFCERNGVPAVFGRGDVASEAQRRKMSVEACARDMRYDFFEAAARGAGASFIATAHNSDDNAETVIFNLARGSSLRGLCGIPPVRGNIIRPLLCVTRAEIEAFLLENGVPWIEDSTNTDARYTRNLIRNEIMPVLRRINPRVSERIFETTSLLRRDENFLAETALTALKGSAPNEASINLNRLCSIAPALRGRVAAMLYVRAGGDARALTGRHIEDILGLCRSISPSARLSLPGGIEAFRRYDELCFGQIPASERFSAAKIAPGQGISLPGFELWCEKLSVNEKFIQHEHTFYIKCANIKGAVLIRSREKGDIIRMSGISKQLKKLMIEKKIPARLRDGIPVVCDEEGILAVYGVGASDRARAVDGDEVLAVTIRETRRNG